MESELSETGRLDADESDAGTVDAKLHELRLCTSLLLDLLELVSFILESDSPAANGLDDDDDRSGAAANGLDTDESDAGTVDAEFHELRLCTSMLLDLLELASFILESDSPAANGLDDDDRLGAAANGLDTDESDAGTVDAEFHELRLCTSLLLDLLELASFILESDSPAANELDNKDGFTPAPQDECGFSLG